MEYIRKIVVDELPSFLSLEMITYTVFALTIRTHKGLVLRQNEGDMVQVE